MAQYLTMRLTPTGAGVIEGFETAREFEAAGLRLKVWVKQRIEHLAPRDPGNVVRELQRLARRHLSQG